MPPVTPASSRMSRKRHIQDDQPHDSQKRRVPVIDLTGDSSGDDKNKNDRTPMTKSKIKKTQMTPPSSSKKIKEECRSRRFRTHPPQTYYEKLHRATTQRMFVISRSRSDIAGALEENVDMVGSVGNIYRVTISLQPSCTCPDALKGNQCKHVIYVLANVLKAREDLRYQLAFLSSELQEMFDNAPLETKDASSSSSDRGSNKKRRPIEGDCPICFMEFEPATEKTVWCEAKCGNNFHKACFDQWAAASRANGVRCVICRTEWPTPTPGPGDLDMKSLMSNAAYGEDGYLNVASAVGLSGERDYSTYNRFWRRRHLGRSYSYASYNYGYGDDDYYY